MNSLIQKPGVHILVLLWAIACFCFFQFGYQYHFFYQEQNQLFLGSWDYVSTYLSKPGWLACLAGDFLTQFYYYRFAGAAILTVALLGVGYNVRCAMEAADIKGTWIPYTTAFVLMTMEACFSLHYDFRLSSVIAFTGGANVFCLSTKILTGTRMLIKKFELQALGDRATISGLSVAHWISLVSIFITVIVCHWFFGYGMWVYGAFVILGCLIHIMEPGNYLRLAALMIPFFLLLLTKRLYYVDFYTIYTYPGIGKIVKPEFALEKTLSVDCEYYFGNYNKVIDIVEKDENPNKYMKFYYNLVVAQSRSLSDNLLRFPDNNLGTFETVGPNTPVLTLKTINELYWLLGDMTFAERAATLANVCSPDNRNIRMVKRLAEINIVTGQKGAAKKYLRMLQKTFVWRGWANRAYAALSKRPTKQQQAFMQPYLEKRKMMNTRDTLRLNDNAYTIMRELVESNPANNLAINYMLCSDLLLKDMESFKHDYDAYYLKQKHVLYDPMYQQALMIYLAGTNAKPAEWAQYIKRTDILQRFEQYNDQRGNPAFSDTYWYYFDKAPLPQMGNANSTDKK